MSLDELYRNRLNSILNIQNINSMKAFEELLSSLVDNKEEILNRFYNSTVSIWGKPTVRTPYKPLLFLILYGLKNKLDKSILEDMGIREKSILGTVITDVLELKGRYGGKLVTKEN